MMTNTQTASAVSHFVRLAQTPIVKDFVKRAKNAGYTVEIGRFGENGKGQIYYYEAKDGANLVFKATMVQRGVWGMKFSTAYWQEPTI
jgi:hypothetical protein